tara:strand:- start:134 stop:703 length:570 start_codon:yes stop_codon:yes gene_type:complete
MKVLTKTELRIKYSEILDKIKKGAIFIHPTDTIYGISCDAENRESVKKLREIKDRPTNPFSVWAPSKEWIKENCQISKKNERWLEELPGPYTLITKLKNKKAIAPEVNVSISTLGVRIPAHWFSQIVKDLDFPIVTTSVNKSGQEFMSSLESLDPEIKKNVSFIIYEGEKKVRPSKIVDLTKEERIITR